MHIISQFVSCAVHSRLSEDSPDEFQDAVNQGYKQIYVISPQGIYKHHKLREGLNGEARFVQVKVDAIPGLKLTETKLEEEICFLPAGKIPQHLFDEIVQFFRQVMAVKKQEVEAMAMILWSAVQGYYIFIPDQVVSKGSARYEWGGLPEGSSIIADVHSHG